ncbi:MAG: DUF1800 domain-containing protein [Alphaproteobacteria bacterium]|nr:DUF1800 domain-containing protein [Alphaproteobacteria bacterium]MBU1515591.1 DUF1800 domain-containing protein [Alphaproteobacteria bacterium]MBU2096926.1 DUF1800 domain-containing protein [Alphaproteobacteria bacterium]MBU2149581.1 DUF1800 domain-containing protein [Alphaproteobacteria bacterium]MBU2305683.1 DUF1800 domain-containing protein [Alphaproteobacteria bacterium]
MLAAISLAACSGVRSTGSSDGTPTPAEAARFLSQTSYGATDGAISQVRSNGYSQWIDQQMSMAPPQSHQADLDARLAALRATNATASLSANDFYYSYWEQAVTGPDQLRQRMKLALSEIFVVSLTDANVDIRGAGSYYDMLGANAFGNFRTLLEQVSLHPMMGIYLTWLGNQKEDPATGRNPDENYAREVMQLMTVGLYQLNIDGTVRRDGAGQPIPTYTAADISGLAKVFTGYSYYSPTPSNTTFRGGSKAADATVRAMIPYAAFHSTSAKSFLGNSIPASATANPSGDLKIALDALFNHPNTGPFISKQLIQRLVTSNPSPAYVERVATVFNNNGAGVRGDMAAVVRAILLDSEARSAGSAAGLNYGKVREPVVRMAHWARAFNAASTSGDWQITSTSANTSLGQSALTSPSVFNFFRPGYSPSNSRVGAAGLVAPEFQIVDEVTVAGYLNTMQTTIDAGVGNTVSGARDVRTTYAAETALANDPGALVDRVNLLLMNGAMSSRLRTRIVEAVGGVTVPAVNPQAALLNRAKLAIYMTMASSEYLVQR